MADNMLIDGLIKFCDEKSKNIKLKAEPQVFVEIKQALEQLKVFKSDGFAEDLLNMGYTKGIKDGYAKAIDEFAEKCITELIQYDCLLDMGDIEKIAEQMKAEQMKAGGIDG